MSKLSKPARAYSAIARAVASRSRARPSRSMSAICQSPVTIRLISSAGASVQRSGAETERGMRSSLYEPSEPPLGASRLADSLLVDLPDQLVDLFTRRLAGG